MTQTQWMNTAEAASYIRVKPRTLLSWSKRGLVPAHRLSGCARVTWRFLASELDRHILRKTGDLLDEHANGC
jgi:predicted site-specific integrase-resolvase